MKKLLILAALVAAMIMTVNAQVRRGVAPLRICVGSNPQGQCNAWEYREGGYLVRQCQGPCKVVVKVKNKSVVCETRGTNMCTAKIKIK